VKWGPGVTGAGELVPMQFGSDDIYFTYDSTKSLDQF
jgi:hypothetical protein